MHNTLGHQVEEHETLSGTEGTFKLGKRCVVFLGSWEADRFTPLGLGRAAQYITKLLGQGCIIFD